MKRLSRATAAAVGCDLLDIDGAWTAAGSPVSTAGAGAGGGEGFTRAAPCNGVSHVAAALWVAIILLPRALLVVEVDRRLTLVVEVAVAIGGVQLLI